jgi:hypothetical protein
MGTISTRDNGGGNVSKSDEGKIVVLPAELRELEPALTRLNEGKPKPGDLKQFRAYLRSNPEEWHEIADLSLYAAQGLIKSFAGKSRLVSEAMEFGRLEIREELGYSASSGLERLLVDHVVLCWMRMYDTERRYTNIMAQELTLGQAAWQERRLSAVQARYLRACEMLARVRKLGVPAVQVNIAEEGGQQVNVAGALTVPPRSGAK